jgi:hypothetical protein
MESTVDELYESVRLLSSTPAFHLQPALYSLLSIYEQKLCHPRHTTTRWVAQVLTLPYLVVSKNSQNILWRKFCTGLSAVSAEFQSRNWWNYKKWHPFILSNQAFFEEKPAIPAF